MSYQETKMEMTSEEPPAKLLKSDDEDEAMDVSKSLMKCIHLLLMFV